MLNIDDFRKLKFLDDVPNAVINNETCKIFVALANDAGQVFPISKSMVSSIQIRDTIFDATLAGTIIINNDNNTLEKLTPVGDKSGNSQFKFKNNGRDYLIVQIRPIITGTSEAQMPKSVRDAVFIEEKFVVYKIEDLDLDKKYLKLEFHATEIQMLAEASSVFSTAKTAKYNASDAARKMETGKAIKAALLEVFSAEDIGTEWGVGAHSIFYTASQNENMFTTLNNLLYYHISENGSPTILKKNRESKKFELLSLDELFKSTISGSGAASKRFIDAFFIEATSAITDKRTPAMLIQRPGGIIVNPANQITQFTVDHKDYTTSFTKIKSQFTSAFDKSSGTFKVRNNTVEKVSKKYESMFVLPFRALGAAKSNVEIHDDMKNNNFFINTPETRADIHNKGEVNLLHNLLFLNTEITFMIKGGTHLKSGYFIHIEPSGISEKNDFIKKTAGVYFITQSIHTLNDSTLMTKVHAIKTYTL